MKFWLTVFDYPTLEMQVPLRFHGHICTVKDRIAKFVPKNALPAIDRRGQREAEDEERRNESVRNSISRLFCFHEICQYGHCAFKRPAVAGCSMQDQGSLHAGNPIFTKLARLQLCHAALPGKIGNGVSHN